MTPEDTEVVERIIGYSFADRELLLQALTHSSAVEDHPDRALLSNERLEFLGDAVLGMVAAEIAFREREACDEGALTCFKAHYVNKQSLATACGEMGLGRFLRLARGEAMTGGTDRPSNLANLFEALVGAVYIDGGLHAAEQFVRQHLLDCHALADPERAHDPKSALQELAQARFSELPAYRVVDREGPSHDPTFTVEVTVGGRVLGQGAGRNKKDAEQQAAEQALQALEKEAAQGT